MHTLPFSVSPFESVKDLVPATNGGFAILLQRIICYKIRNAGWKFKYLDKIGKDEGVSPQELYIPPLSL